MQSYDLNLTPTVKSVTINAQASGIWYESGQSAINTRIKVTPERGSSIELKPGQRVKLTEQIGTWLIESLNPAATIVGKLLIGSGEFEDNSSLVTLDASFANNVTIMNANVPVTISGGDVEIKNDAGNPIPTLATIAGTPSVTISGTANVQENLFPVNANLATNSQLPFLTTIITPAANTNGVILQSAKLFGCSSANAYSIIAKATAPANEFDGIVLLYVPSATTSSQFIELTNKLKIPSGMGLYIYSNSNTPAAIRFVNASIL